MPPSRANLESGSASSRTWQPSSEIELVGGDDLGDQPELEGLVRKRVRALRTSGVIAGFYAEAGPLAAVQLAQQKIANTEILELHPGGQVAEERWLLDNCRQKLAYIVSYPGRPTARAAIPKCGSPHRRAGEAGYRKGGDEPRRYRELPEQ